MGKFDIEAAEKQMRRDFTAAQAAGIEMVQNGADPEFLRAQRMFDEARIQFVLACMKCDNGGIDRNATLSSAGHAVGAIWSGLLMACVGERERSMVNGWVRQSFATALHLDPNDKTLMSIFGEQKLDG